jgi:hypothetical protein
MTPSTVSPMNAAGLPSPGLRSGAPTSDLWTPTAPARWVARVVAGLAIAFLVFDAALKLLQVRAAIEGSATLGFSASDVLTIGLIELALLVLYVIPRTAPIGAVLWTGYLGGAIATHLRLGNPLFSHILFPIYVAILLWLPLYLRDSRVRGLVGPRQVDPS